MKKLISIAIITLLLLLSIVPAFATYELCSPSTNNLSPVAINPQPEPPGIWVTINPQPEPPGITILR